MKLLIEPGNKQQLNITNNDGIILSLKDYAVQSSEYFSIEEFNRKNIIIDKIEEINYIFKDSSQVVLDKFSKTTIITVNNIISQYSIESNISKEDMIPIGIYSGLIDLYSSYDNKIWCIYINNIKYCTLNDKTKAEYIYTLIKNELISILNIRWNI